MTVIGQSSALMPMIALALAETIWGHTEATTLVSNKDLGCPCLRSSARSRRSHRPSYQPLRSSQISILLSAVPTFSLSLRFCSYREKPSVGSPSSPIPGSSSTFIQQPPESSHPTATLRLRPG
ncbi:hypothetical protein BKA70DRAFT_369938 [Coprinopsis sp. MPI-PUGE-AT-0042]|nr:hypothetical protein BKA70DRAFT_369938 [Coprinopsis sp. MPI-PUGE-AT-0042]